MNATVNAFNETKKLKLKQSKCAAIHVGNKSKPCPTLKIHGEDMHREESTKYLGYIVHESEENQREHESKGSLDCLRNSGNSFRHSIG